MERAMKVRTLSVILCVAAAFTVVLGGCRKKPESTETEAPQPHEKQGSISGLASGAAEAASEMKDKAVAKVLDIAQQFQADQESTVAEIAERAQEMAADNLRKMAEKYHTTITATQRKVKELTEQFIAIPDAEKDGPAAVDLKATLDAVYKSLQPLKERFQVYYDVLKEKTGSVAGLEL